jgi:hypothetical protein
MPLADFNEMALDHGDDLASSPEARLLPVHCAAKPVEPNMAVLQAMTMIN